MIDRIRRYISNNKILVISAVILFLIKLINLDQLYLLRGERDIVFTGYSLAKTARDLYGNFLPLQFSKLDMATPFFSFYYSALWWLILPIRSVFTARLPYVVLSISLIFLVYEIVYAITKNRSVSILTSLIFSFSPGIFHLTRLSLEINLAMPLLSLGVLLYLKEKKLWAYVVLALSYFTYNGFRPIIPFFLVYLEFYFLLVKKKPKQFLIENAKNIVFFIILFAISFQIIDGNMMLSRKADLVFFNKEKIDNLVIFRRNTAIGPTILKKLFNNKLTSQVYYMIEVFVQGQGLGYLFLKGDQAAIYATTFTGQFFLVTMILYYMGFMYLGRKWDKKYFYVLGIIPVSLISSMINIDYVSVAIRSMPASIGYAFIIACGAYFAWHLVTRLRPSVKFIVISTFGILTLIELAYFGYNYYYRRPVTMSEAYFESERQLGLYLLKNNKHYTIYDDSPRNIYATYLFLKPNINMTLAQANFRTGENRYDFDGFILKKCPSSPKEIPFVKNTIVADSCLDIPTYDKLNSDPNVKKIKFKDFSLRTAYFIIE